MGQAQDIAWFYAQLRTMGVSQRYQDATKAELYYNGQQYADMPDPDDSSVPFRSRRPRVILPLAKEAIDAIVRFTWGGHRFPRLRIEPTRGVDEADRKGDVGPRLVPEDALMLTRFARALEHVAKLPQVFKVGSLKAAIGRSAAVVLGIRGGYPVSHVEPGKHCAPTFHPDIPGRLSQLEIQYQYPKEIELATGMIKVIPHWYRRTITATDDTVYVEVPVVPGAQPQWTVDPEKSVKNDYGLPYAPVVWLRTMPQDDGDIDGQPVVDPQLYALIDDVNFTVSQRSRALKHVTDPQTVLTGVDGSDGDFLKSPGMPWFLPKEGEAKFLELTGTGIQRSTEHVEHLSDAFRAACSYVKANPDTTSGHLSGVVLEFLHAPMIALAADLRHDFGDAGYCQAVAIYLHMIANLVSAGQSVWIPGVGQAVDIITKAQLAGPWMDPPVRLSWAAWFPESEQDKQVRVQTAVAAKQAGAIASDTMVRDIGEVFGVEDAQAEIDKIESDKSNQPEPPATTPPGASLDTDKSTDGADTAAPIDDEDA